MDFPTEESVIDALTEEVRELERHIKMLTDSWVCLSCGKQGDFELLGKGFIKCSGCGQVHFIENGKLLQVEGEKC